MGNLHLFQDRWAKKKKIYKGNLTLLKGHGSLRDVLDENEVAGKDIMEFEVELDEELHFLVPKHFFEKFSPLVVGKEVEAHYTPKAKVLLDIFHFNSSDASSKKKGK